MFSPLTSNLCLTAVPNYSQEVQAPYHFLWQCAFLMFLKLISQRKAWSLQKCWVPYKHWGNVYIICAKKIAQIKPRVCRVQAPRTTGKLSTSFDIILYPETCFTTPQEVHLYPMQYMKYIYKVYPYQQSNNKLMMHILQLSLVQALNKRVQKDFLLSK